MSEFIRKIQLKLNTAQYKTLLKILYKEKNKKLEDYCSNENVHETINQIINIIEQIEE